MTAPGVEDSDLKALSELTERSSGLKDLDERLTRFNLFQVIGSAYSEELHSNILAWLFDPDRPHGFGSRFLQSWLRRVVQPTGTLQSSSVSPDLVDSWQLDRVEVRTDWAATLEEIQENRRIDILLVLTMSDGERWVVCIENKVRSSQHTGQLAAYRKIITERFPDAARRIFVFLTKDAEKPVDPAYIPATYLSVHEALVETLTQSDAEIAPEPRLMIEHYVRLLHEQFTGRGDATGLALTLYRYHPRAIEIIARVAKGSPSDDGDSKIAERAREAYRLHRSALDLVFRQASRTLWPHAKRPLEAMIATEGPSNGLLPGPIDKKPLVRFVPAQWDLPGNHSGTGWKNSRYQILFELDLAAVPPNLLVVCHAPPAEWDTTVRKHLEDHGFVPPKGAKSWSRYLQQKCDLPAGFELLVDPARAAAALFEWLTAFLGQPDMSKIIRVITSELPGLAASSGKSEA